MTDFLRKFIFILLVLLFQPAQAEEGDAPWRPPVDKYDWVQLDSGEWLKGEISSMYNDVLKFDSDNLGLLDIDWEDIDYLRSASYASINIEGVGSTWGQLEIDDETVTLHRINESLSYSRLNLVSLTPFGDKEIDLWTVDLTLSLNVRQGNTDQFDYTSRLSAKRREAKTRLSFDYVGNVSKTDAGTGSYVDTVDNNRFSGSWDVYATRYFFYTPLFAEYYSDPFQNIDRRLTAGVGIGYSLLDTAKVEWKVNGGPAYQNIRYISVLPGQDADVNGGALVLGTYYSNDINSKLDFSLKYDVTLTSSDLGGYTHHLLASLETELTSKLDFDVSFIWDRVGDPREDQNGVRPEEDDYKLTFGLSWSL